MGIETSDGSGMAHEFMHEALVGNPEVAAKLALVGREALRDSVAKMAARRWPEISDAHSAWRDVFNSREINHVLYNLGVALWLVDESSGAIRAFSVAARLGDREAQLALGEAQLFLGAFVEAEFNLVPLARLRSPTGKKAAGILGDHYFRHDGRVDREVARLLVRAGRVEDKFPVTLGEVLMKTGATRRAVHLLARESKRGNTEAPIVLGNIYEDLLHRPDLAERYFLRGVDLGDAFSAYNLAGLLHGQGRGTESTRWLRHAAALGDERATKRLSGMQ